MRLCPSKKLYHFVSSRLARILTGATYVVHQLGLRQIPCHSLTQCQGPSPLLTINSEFLFHLKPHTFFFSHCVHGQKNILLMHACSLHTKTTLYAKHKMDRCVNGCSYSCDIECCCSAPLHSDKSRMCVGGLAGGPLVMTKHGEPLRRWHKKRAGPENLEEMEVREL